MPAPTSASADQSQIDVAVTRAAVETLEQRAEAKSPNELSIHEYRSRTARKALEESDPEQPDWADTLREAQAEAEAEDQALITFVEADTSAARASAILTAHVELVRERVASLKPKVLAERDALGKGGVVSAAERASAGHRAVLALEEQRLAQLERIADNFVRRQRALDLLVEALSRASEPAAREAALDYASSLGDDLERLVRTAPRQTAGDAVVGRLEAELTKIEATIQAGTAGPAALQSAALLTRLVDRLRHQQKAQRIELAQARTTLTETETRAETLDAARESDSLETLRQRYSRARDLFGENHVTLAPILYATKNADRGGVAGVIAVPLIGIGGGYGWDFFPDVQTEEESRAFLRFEQGLRTHRRALSSFVKLPQVPEAVRARRLASLIQVFREMILEDIAAETEWLLDKKDELLGCLEELANSSEPPEKRLEGLDELWIEYEHLRDYDAPRRADVLIAPHYGIPITDEPTERALLGGGLETHLGVILLGSKWWGRWFGLSGSGWEWWREQSSRLRVTLSAGAESRYGGRYAFDVDGWFVGLGLSGEYSDDLFNLLTGASDAASGL